MEKKHITKFGKFCAAVRKTNLTEVEQREIIDLAGEALLAGLKDSYNQAKNNVLKKYN